MSRPIRFCGTHASRAESSTPSRTCMRRPPTASTWRRSLRAVQANGHEVITVESLAPSPDQLNPLQEAFRDNHGLQCGFCTPGMLMTLTEFLRDNPNPTEQEVRIAISGNLCRCTGYQGIVAAALDAAKRLQGQAPS